MPREIDALCSGSLRHAAAAGEGWVTPGMVLQAWRARKRQPQHPVAVSPPPPPPRRRRRAPALVVPLAFAALLLALGRTPRPPAPADRRPAAPRPMPIAVAPETPAPDLPASSGPPPAARAPVQPFPRQVGPRQWRLQVAALRDAAAARAAREQLARRGLDAEIVPAVVEQTMWHRVLVGRYSTRADAERAATTLAALP
jgi:septal ring-binding cell division protein DamX